MLQLPFLFVYFILYFLLISSGIFPLLLFRSQGTPSSYFRTFFLKFFPLSSSGTLSQITFLFTFFMFPLLNFAEPRCASVLRDQIGRFLTSVTFFGGEVGNRRVLRSRREKIWRQKYRRRIQEFFGSPLSWIFDKALIFGLTRKKNQNERFHSQFNFLFH